MKKLSEQFLELSQRAAVWENRTAAIRQENHKEFEANVAEAQASVKSAQAAFTARLDKVEEPIAAEWRKLKDSFDMHVAHVRQAAAARKAAHDLEAYAEIAAEFAKLTATEAETAMVEAKQARAAAQSMAKVRP